MCVSHLKNKLYGSEFRSSSINTKQRLFSWAINQALSFSKWLWLSWSQCRPYQQIAHLPLLFRHFLPQFQLMKQHFLTLLNTMDIECIGMYYVRHYSNSIWYSTATSFIFTHSGWLDQSLSLSASEILIVMAQRLEYIGLQYDFMSHQATFAFFHPSWLSQSPSIICPCPPTPLQLVHQSRCQEARHKDPRPVGLIFGSDTLHLPGLAFRVSLESL